MKTNIKLFLLSLLMGISFASFSQTQEIKLNPDKVAKFEKYMEFKHGGTNFYPQWKATNKMLWAQEMWYYTESFYVKRNYLAEGNVMDESILDVSRFENQRKENEEAIVTFPGFKDVIVLLPNNKLIYKVK
jgi:hypothetical protein